MATLIVDEEIAKKLHMIAEREQRPVGEVLRSMVDTYTPRKNEQPDEALLAFLGAFDDDVNDLSSTVRETMREYFKKQQNTA